MMFKHCIYKAIFGLNTNAEPFTVSEQMKPQGANHTILTQNYVYSDVCSDATWLQQFLQVKERHNKSGESSIENIFEGFSDYGM